MPTLGDDSIEVLTPRPEGPEMELDVVAGNADDRRCKGPEPAVGSGSPSREGEGSAEHAAASDEVEPGIPLETAALEATRPNTSESEAELSEPLSARSTYTTATATLGI